MLECVRNAGMLFLLWRLEGLESLDCMSWLDGTSAAVWDELCPCNANSCGGTLQSMDNERCIRYWRQTCDSDLCRAQFSSKNIDIALAIWLALGLKDMMVWDLSPYMEAIGVHIHCTACFTVIL